MKPEKTKPPGWHPAASEVAEVWDNGGDDDTGDTPPRLLALFAVDTGREILNRYALDTDWPEAGVVEALDHLDAARDCLAQGGER